MFLWQDSAGFLSATIPSLIKGYSHECAALDAF